MSDAGYGLDSQERMGLDNPLHIAFLVVILLLVFGARRLPDIGRSLGSGMREFKHAITGETPTGETPQPTITPAQGQPQPPVQTPVAPPVQTPVAEPAPPQPAPPQPAPVEPQHHG
jgi:sec-independent protein translocase protein TatA